MKKWKKIVAVTGTALAAGLLLVGCSSGAAAKKDAPKEITMATVGTTKPFSYADSNGDLTGFDVELARAIFKDSDKYTLKLQKVDGTAQYPGLDAGKFDMLGNNTSYTEERAEKYLYSLPTASTPAVLAVDKNSDIKSIDDIGGHSSQAVSGTTTAKQLEDYNASHDKQVTIDYTGENITKILHNVNDGKYDFKIFDAPSVKSIIKDQGLDNLKTIDIPSDQVPYIYYIFTKDNTELQEFVNKRIKELYADGTVAKLAKEFLGGDYAPKKEDIEK